MFTTLFTILFTFVALVVATYYKNISFESSSTYIGYYLAIVASVYSLYRYFHEEREELSGLGIAFAGGVQLFLLLLFYFISTLDGAGTIIGATCVGLFKILSLIIIPLVTVLLFFGLGKEIRLRLSLPKWIESDHKIRLLLEFGMGLSVFILITNILSFVGLYTTTVFLLLYGILIGISYRSIIQFLFDDVFGSRYIGQYTTTGDQIYRTVRDIGIFFISFVAIISLINILRPMPIGWDDLGVYMNYPRLIAQEGSSIGYGNISWQVVTGIGFLFGSAPQAFFMNQIGGWMLVLIAILSLQIFLTGHRKVTWSILGSAFLLSLPMLVFQQAKDMKVDPALFALSIVAFTLTFLFHQHKEGVSNERHTLLACIGICIGIAFAIKITSLMLLLGIIGTILYARMGGLGVLATFSGIIGVFTLGNLWKLMNVVVPNSGTVYYSISAVSMGIFGAVCAFFWQKHRDNFKNSIQQVGILIFATILSFSPWILKNSYETFTSNSPVSISALLSGIGNTFALDFSKVFDKATLKQKEDAKQFQGMLKEGKSDNEDLGRYLGYDSGINNHVRMPYNLTFQKNQGGEFTEISFIFLAFIPAIFLFLRHRSQLWLVGTLIASSFIFITYFIQPEFITRILGMVSFPIGYLVLLGGVGYACVVAYIGLSSGQEIERRFQWNFAFFSLYGFLFIVATFGIVWYGIMMYYTMLLAIFFGIERLDSREIEGADMRDIGFGIFPALIFGIWFFFSVLPHGWFNLQASGFEGYKSTAMTVEQSIFSNRPDYLEPLSILNIRDENEFLTKTLKELSLPLPGSGSTLPSLAKYAAQLSVLQNQRYLQEQNINPEQLVVLRKLQNKVYQGIYQPSVEFANTGKIYRIGTFFSYFIHDNRRRFLDDSLLFTFDIYLREATREATVENFRKTGIKYLLVDLNAATIDRDPSHKLTQRFEALLDTFRSKNLKLVSTDSLCLKLGLEDAHRGVVSTQADYISIAGVNHESYRVNESGREQVQTRGEKQVACYNRMYQLISKNQVNEKQYSFLLPLLPLMQSAKNIAEISSIFERYVTHGWYALFEIAPKDENKENTQTSKSF